MASARTTGSKLHRLATASASPRRTPTQARSRQTVEVLLDAAAEVFDEHGFEATTERIVERAGVSVGSLYQYFPNKDALIAALAERYCTETAASQRAWLAWLASAEPSLDDGLRSFVDWLVEQHTGRPRLRCLLFEARPAPHALASRMVEVHAATVAGLAAWLVGRVHEPRVAAVMLHAAVPGLVHRFVLHPHDDLPVERARAEVFRMARAYLAGVERG